MTTEEFSDRFDVMLNSYSIRSIAGDITFDEYEKSLFLTKAQQQIVLSLYSGKNTSGDSFENTEEARRYLANLVANVTLLPITNSTGIPLGVASSSKFFTLPENLWFLTYESVTTSNGKCPGKSAMKVFPVRQDEYQAIKDNPFRGANDRRALRLDLADGIVEIVCKYNVTKYHVRYVKKVPPIILVDLPDGLTIDSGNTVSECILHKALHQRILDLAVQMAVQSRAYGASSESKNQ